MRTKRGKPMPGSRMDVNAIKKWVAILTTPSVAAFEAEKPYVNIAFMISWLVIGGVVLGLIVRIARVTSLSAEGYNPYQIDVIDGGLIRFLILGAIAFPIEYLILEGIQLWIARAHGGTGDLITQSYLQSTYLVPISIIAGLLSLIPNVGVLLLALVGIYALYLTTLALRAAHHLNTRDAVFTWAFAVGGTAIVSFVLLFCLFWGLMAYIYVTTGHSPI